MKRLTAYILMFCMMLPLTACANTNPGSSGASESASPNGATIASIPTQSIFRFTQAAMPKLDPHCGSDMSSNTIHTNCYDPLVFPTATGSVEPWIAETWEVSDDGLVWTFHIRDDVKFHSGNPLTANDVKYTVDRLCNIGEGYAYLFYKYIDSTEVVDEYTVKLNCNQEYGPLLTNLVRLYILDSELMKANTKAEGDYGENGDFGKNYLLEHDAGSGPYTVTKVETNISVTGKKFQDYWAGIPDDAPETFIHFASNDAVTVKTKMLRKELEAADSYQTAENISSMLAADSSLKLAYNYTGGGSNLWFNNQKAPLDDPKIREAFGYIIDYNTVNTIITPDSVYKKSIVPSGLLGYTEVFDFTYDIEKAKACIAESKYADTIGNYEIEFVWNSETADREKIALMIQAAAQQIGVNIKITELPWSTIVANATNVDTSPQMTICQITPVTGDSGTQFVSMLQTKEVGTWENMNWVNDSTLDKMIVASLAIADQDKRATAYAEIQKYCAEKVVFVPINETPERLVYQDSYVDLAPSIPMSGYSFYLRDIAVHPAS